MWAVSNLYFLSVLRYFPKILIKLIILFSLFLELCYFPSPLDVFISSIYSLPLILILYFYIFQAFQESHEELLQSCIRTEEMKTGEIRELSWNNKAGE